MNWKFWKKDQPASRDFSPSRETEPPMRGESRPSNAGKYSAVGTAALVGAIALGGITTTDEKEIRIVTQGGKAVDTLNTGYGYKIPFFQSTYDLRSDLMQISPPPTSIGFQNGNVTAKDINSTAFIRLAGSRMQQEETVRIIFKDMYDFTSRTQSLAENALRDVVRTAVLPPLEDPEAENKGAKAAKPVEAKSDGRPDFMNSELIGSLVARNLQASLDRIIPGKINVGTAEKPQMVSRIEVIKFAINNFEWDDEYKAQRKKIQDSRASAESARYGEQEGLRNAAKTRAQAEGEKDAEISRGQGKATAELAMKTAEADGIRLIQEAQADGITKRINAAGSVEKLVSIINAEQWNGSLVTTSGATAIVDARAPSKRSELVVPAPAVK